MSGGSLRATYDVDFLILAQCTDPQPFLGLLRTAGFAINETWHDANPMAREVVLRLVHPTAPHFPVDLVFSVGPFELFRTYARDHRLSFCDAISFVVVTSLLDYIPCFTFDDDFRALGLTVLP